MGRQTIETEAGRFEGCLVVRYTGVLAKRGRSEIAGIGLPTGGRVTTTEWYARGVGLVRSKRSGTIDLTCETALRESCISSTTAVCISTRFGQISGKSPRLRLWRRIFRFDPERAGQSVTGALASIQIFPSQSRCRWMSSGFAWTAR